jgi:hypothetical protein
MRRITAVALAFAPVLSAGYSNLIATADGTTVYFQVVGFGPESWYALRTPAIEPVNLPLADVSASGAVVASALDAERYCGFAGSSCFLQPDCQADFSIQGPGIQTGNSRRRTFVRLDRMGAIAWIDQDSGCGGLGLPPLPPALNGLYDSSTLRQIAPARGAKLANQRHGRRVITDGGRALTFVGIQLTWLDAAGSHPIRHVAGAFEAVTDQMGDSIVYTEAPAGELHWIGAQDDDLGLSGSAPALSDDGRTLVYLAADGSLQVYDRATQVVQQLGADTYVSFMLSSDAIFAVTSDDRLVRIEVASGAASDLLQPFPEIATVAAPSGGPICPLVCYGTPKPSFAVDPGMIVALRGRNMDQPGWSARFKTSGADVVADIAINVRSEKAAWFQVPSDLDVSNSSGVQNLEIYNPNLPFNFGAQVSVADTAIACFATFHEDFSRRVLTDDPASLGEIVHLFLTGLHGDGAVNVPALADPGAVEVVSSGLVPRLIGIQRLDLRILRAQSDQQFSLFNNVPAFGCAPPAVAAP